MPLDLFTVGDPIADTKAPTDVPIGERWSTRRFRARLGVGDRVADGEEVERHLDGLL